MPVSITCHITKNGVKSTHIVSAADYPALYQQYMADAAVTQFNSEYHFNFTLDEALAVLRGEVDETDPSLAVDAFASAACVVGNAVYQELDTPNDTATDVIDWILYLSSADFEKQTISTLAARRDEINRYVIARSETLYEDDGKFIDISIDASIYEGEPEDWTEGGEWQ